MLVYRRHFSLRFIDRQRLVSNTMPRLRQHMGRRRRRLLKISKTAHCLEEKERALRLSRQLLHERHDVPHVLLVCRHRQHQKVREAQVGPIADRSLFLMRCSSVVRVNSTQGNLFHSHYMELSDLAAHHSIAA
jgi:hypothetical protein